VAGQNKRNKQEGGFSAFLYFVAILTPPILKYFYFLGSDSSKLVAC
jgi:hypothetical protein